MDQFFMFCLRAWLLTRQRMCVCAFECFSRENVLHHILGEEKPFRNLIFKRSILIRMTLYRMPTSFNNKIKLRYVNSHSYRDQYSFYLGSHYKTHADTQTITSIRLSTRDYSVIQFRNSYKSIRSICLLKAYLAMSMSM